MRRLNLLVGCALALSLAGCSGDATAPARPQVPTASVSATSTLYVTIYGPDQVSPAWRDCTWAVSVSGGTPPYTYQWSPWRMVEMSTWDEYWQGYASATGYVSLDVFVTDAVGRQGSAGLLINSTFYADPCF